MDEVASSSSSVRSADMRPKERQGSSHNCEFDYLSEIDLGKAKAIGDGLRELSVLERCPYHRIRVYVNFQTLSDQLNCL